MTKTTNYGLPQWEGSDRVLRTDFNEAMADIDAALQANADAVSAEALSRAAGDVYVKLLDLTLEADTQKWDIDMSAIDLTQYQKLLFYPHLKGNNNQWVFLHINGLSSGYSSEGSNPKYCGQVPLMNDPGRQNFGLCEFTFLIALPDIYVEQLGVYNWISNDYPYSRGYKCPRLETGATHLETLNLWYDNTSYKLQTGSAVQLYGLKR